MCAALQSPNLPGAPHRWKLRALSLVHSWQPTLSAAGTRRQILTNVSGSTRHTDDTATGAPTLLAILGPSGAGKSTLLDVLAGRPGQRTVAGRINLDGTVVPPSTLQRVCGYVLQDDVFPGEPCPIMQYEFSVLSCED